MHVPLYVHVDVLDFSHNMTNAECLNCLWAESWAPEPIAIATLSHWGDA